MEGAARAETGGGGEANSTRCGQARAPVLQPRTIMRLPMSPHFRVAAITDEFSPDLETAVASMAEVGMTGAELRMVFGKNIAGLTDEELDRAIAIVRAHGLEIISIASPLLKCVLPDAP